MEPRLANHGLYQTSCRGRSQDQRPGRCAAIFWVSEDEDASVTTQLLKGQCVLSDGAVLVRGNVILSEPATRYSDFFITFCEEDVLQCTPGAAIDSRGNFQIGLLPGKYRVSINAAVGGESIGWYSSSGLVPSIACAKVVRVYVNQTVDITIDLRPAKCPS